MFIIYQSINDANRSCDDMAKRSIYQNVQSFIRCKTSVLLAFLIYFFAQV